MTGFRAMESEKVGSGLFVLFFFKILCPFHNCMQFHKHVLVKLNSKWLAAAIRSVLPGARVVAAANYIALSCDSFSCDVNQVDFSIISLVYVHTYICESQRHLPPCSRFHIWIIKMPVDKLINSPTFPHGAVSTHQPSKCRSCTFPRCHHPPFDTIIKMPISDIHIVP